MRATLLFALIAPFLYAQPSSRGLPRGVNVPASGTGRRTALVIGNDAYPNNPLHNALNDARSMKAALEDAGFVVQMSLNATLQQIETEVDEFTGGVHPGDIALFFYSGHGLQINDENYLVPTDFQARTAIDAKYKAYPAQRVQENLEAAGAGMQILILDACRNNPFRTWRGTSTGLAAMQAGRGTYIAFATSPGKTADDNPNGKNGLFTGELISVLRESGLSIDQVFNSVRERVSSKSQGRQLPWSTSSVTGEFYFMERVEASGTSPGPHRDLAGEKELAFWNSIKDEDDAALLEEYLRRYPEGEFANIAKARINRLKAPVRSTPASAPSREHLPGERKVNPKDGLTYVWIPSATYQMGCSDDDSQCFTIEKPSHAVSISRGFWIGQTDVTMAAYKRYANATNTPLPPEKDSYGRVVNAWTRGDTLPAVLLTWDEATVFCGWSGMRLPTEAQWELAARAGTKSARYGDIDQIAWYGDNSGRQRIDSDAIERTDPKNSLQRLLENGNGQKQVGQKQPNAYGLYDMLGNVWQWMADWYSPTYYASREKDDPGGPRSGEARALRGGAWSYSAKFIRVSARGRSGPGLRDDAIGFRCAGDLP